MSKDPRVYLAHVLECIQKIECFTVSGKRRFLCDELIQDAVLCNLEIIGEAAKRVDDAYRAAHPEIPWQGMAGLRDVLIHRYEGVDIPRVWSVVKKDCLPCAEPSRSCCRCWKSWNANWRAKQEPHRRPGRSSLTARRKAVGNEYDHNRELARKHLG